MEIIHISQRVSATTAQQLTYDIVARVPEVSTCGCLQDYSFQHSENELLHGLHIDIVPTSA